MVNKKLDLNVHDKSDGLLLLNSTICLMKEGKWNEIDKLLNELQINNDNKNEPDVTLIDFIINKCLFSEKLREFIINEFAIDANIPVKKNKQKDEMNKLEKSEEDNDELDKKLATFLPQDDEEKPDKPQIFDCFENEFFEAAKYLIRKQLVQVLPQGDEEKPDKQRIFDYFENKFFEAANYLTRKIGLINKASPLNTTLYSAIAAGQLELAKHLIATCGINVNTYDEDETEIPSLLHTAIKSNNVAIVKFLVADCGADLNRHDNEDETPLHVAARSGNVEIVEYLITDCGADVSKKNDEGDTPLYLAVDHNNVELVKYLITNCGVDVNKKSNDGDTPLHWAVYNDKVALVKYLVKNGRADVNISNEEGRTPFQCAVSDWVTKSQSFEIVKFFIENANIDIDTNIDNESAVILRKNNFDNIDFLLGHRSLEINPNKLPEQLKKDGDDVNLTAWKQLFCNFFSSKKQLESDIMNANNSKKSNIELS